MSGLQFKFSCLLTAMHYMVTTVGLELLRLGGVYESRASPITPRLLMLVLLVGRHAATAALPPPPPQHRHCRTAAPLRRYTSALECMCTTHAQHSPCCSSAARLTLTLSLTRP
eukprot:scaffold62443_cov55-Phaeocystis_antarctica.AAC.3